MGTCLALSLPFLVSFRKQEGVTEQVRGDGLEGTVFVKNCILAREQLLHHLRVGNDESDDAWALLEDNNGVDCSIVAINAPFRINLVAEPQDELLHQDFTAVFNFFFAVTNHGRNVADEKGVVARYWGHTLVRVKLDVFHGRHLSVNDIGHTKYS